jgi:hypothetical protein
MSEGPALVPCGLRIVRAYNSFAAPLACGRYAGGWLLYCYLHS